MSEATVVAEKLSKVYRQGKVEVVALRSASLTVNRGELVAIMGPSGSGKTTFLSIIGCLLTPSSGQLYLMGEEVDTSDQSLLTNLRRYRIGFIFQSFNLFAGLSVLENVMLSFHLIGINGREAREKASHLLELVGLKERLDFLPKDLSGGEKQRVAIARALAKDPPIILADEPTGNLDSTNSRKIMELLKELASHQDKSILVVTHDVQLSQIADRICYLKDGVLE